MKHKVYKVGNPTKKESFEGEKMEKPKDKKLINMEIMQEVMEKIVKIIEEYKFNSTELNLLVAELVAIAKKWNKLQEEDRDKQNNFESVLKNFKLQGKSKGGYVG